MNETEWKQIEEQVENIIKKKATKFARYVGNGYDYDDGVQEARMSLLQAIAKYDEKEGELKSFAYAVVENRFLSVLSKMSTQSRRAITVPIVTGSDDCEQRGSINEETLADASVDVESDADISYVNALINEFKTELKSNLKGLAAVAYDYRTCPMLRKAIFGDDDVPSIALAKHLGVTKNKMDWALFTIRGKFTKIARKEKYQSLFGLAPDTIDWPHQLVSRKTYDTTLLDKAVEKWGLDVVPVEVFEETENDCWLCRITYSWGSALYWVDGNESYSAVLIGEFNHLSGQLFGTNGRHEKMVYGSKYRSVLRKINKGE